MDFDTVLKFRMEFLHSLGIKNENKSVRGLEKRLDNEECKVNHSRLDVRRKSGKSEAIILFQLGKTVVEFLDVKLVALFLVLVFAASSHLFCQS